MQSFHEECRLTNNGRAETAMIIDSALETGQVISCIFGPLNEIGRSQR